MYPLNTTGTSSLYTYMLTGSTGRKGFGGGGVNTEYTEVTPHTLSLEEKVINIEHLADRGRTHTESIPREGIWGGRARDGHIITGSWEKHRLGKGSRGCRNLICVSSILHPWGGKTFEEKAQNQVHRRSSPNAPRSDEKR